MLIGRWASIATLGFLLCGCASAPHGADAGAVPALVPAPVEVQRASGYFEVAAGTVVTPPSGDASAASVVGNFAALVRRTRGLPLDVRETGRSDHAIVFTLDPGFDAGGERRDEAYELTVATHGITLTARTPHGLFNGSTTLWQLLASGADAQAAVRVPALHIVDYPRLAWRGLLLDSARHFQSPEFIERFIDDMALHKLNVLHWHLTDDQGWRIQIRRYPELTATGAWRAPQPNEAALADPATGMYGGFYTQEEIRAIVRHAAERFVTIVPEIDMPGHSQAAIAAYPQLGATGKRLPVSSSWGAGTDICNVDESTFDFIDGVLEEVTQLFPSPYIHVGGDEVAKDYWQASERVQERMRRLGVRDERELQGYFTARLEAMLRKRGRRLVGWDEILESGLPPGAIVMSWRGSAGAVAAARHGDDVVLAPDPVTYLDHLQASGPGQPPGRIKVLSLADVYTFDPVPRELDADQARHVLGAQANLWSEYLTTPARVEYAAFPRAAALAERLWSPAARADWNDFVARLPALYARYRRLDMHYSDDAVAPEASVSLAAVGRMNVVLTQQVAIGSIRYTLDGRAPSARSPIYRAPLLVDAPALLRAATFVGPEQVSGERTQQIDPAGALRRSSDRLTLCGDKLLLRLEGAAQGTIAAPLYDVDLMDPCWIYPQLAFDGIARIDVRIGALPYFFELGHDAAGVVRHAPGGDADELQLRLDTCAGPLLGAVPLTPQRNAAATVSVPVTRQAGVHDLCLYFATRGPDPLRLIEWVEPGPQEH